MRMVAGIRVTDRVNFDQGKRNLFRLSGEFELSEFELKGVKPNGVRVAGS